MASTVILTGFQNSAQAEAFVKWFSEVGSKGSQLENYMNAVDSYPPSVSEVASEDGDVTVALKVRTISYEFRGYPETLSGWFVQGTMLNDEGDYVPVIEWCTSKEDAVERQALMMEYSRFDDVVIGCKMPKKYQYRNLIAVNDIGEDWCIMGVDTNSIGISRPEQQWVLEWCSDEQDAEALLKLMSEYKQFQNLKIGRM